MSKPVPFDDMIDVAFAETYAQACKLEDKNEIEPNNSIEELARDCKQIAADFVDKYEAACKIGGYPDFYGGLASYAYAELKKKYPPLKHFDVLIDAQMTLTWPVFAKDKEEAEKLAQDFMQSSSFEAMYRKEARFYETDIGDVIEP